MGSPRSSSYRRFAFSLRPVVALCAFAFVLVAQSVDAVIPSAVVTLRSTDGSDSSTTKTKTTTTTTLMLAGAVFGPNPPSQGKGDASDAGGDNGKRLVFPPTSNPFLCQDADDAAADPEILESTKGAWMLVPRGGCTYEYKTWIAQSIYGSVGVIVRNALATRYRFNETDDNGEPGDNSIVWPSEYVDYDCDNARAEIPSDDLEFFSTPDEALSANGYASPYDFVTNDVLLSGDTTDNLCKIHDANDLRNCPSKRCLVAHDIDDGDSATAAAAAAAKDTITVCCAWDILLNPYTDIDLDRNVTIDIPTLFATMEQGDVLSEAMETLPSLTIAVYSRWRPSHNFSSVIIVMLGVAVAAFAAFRSADDYHFAASKLWKSASTLARGSKPEAASGSGRPQESLVSRNNSSMSEESLELEPIHALLFLVMSSVSLFVLFFFKIYNVAKVMYAFGCSNAFVQIMVYPLLSRVLSSQFFRSSRSGKHCFRERVLYRTEEFGDITNWNILANVIGYSMGLVWLYMALCIPKAGDKFAFYWIAQDVLGLCICVVFLGIIQLNSIQVASILLIAAFFYDIFFVFVTPYIFHGRSVMIEVATSGGPPVADELWCEKYPSDPDCRGGDPMPMLFSVPRLFDYQGGSSMLGLGDIVLPGLLLSFAARLDAARLVYALYSANSRSDGSDQTRRTRAITPIDGRAVAVAEQGSSFPAPMPVWYALTFGGYGYYFVPVVIGYAIGLSMANVAVYLMNMGQPALLYLVPCTLGTMAYKGWKRNELMSLWNGPEVLKQADWICYEDPSHHDSSRGEGGAVSVAAGTTEGMELQDNFVEEGNGDTVPLMRSAVDPSSNRSE